MPPTLCPEVCSVDFVLAVLPSMTPSRRFTLKSTGTM